MADGFAHHPYALRWAPWYPGPTRDDVTAMKPKVGRDRAHLERILALIEKKPLYYAEVIEAFPEASQQAITRAFGKLHADEKLWQDPEGRMCVRGSKFAAVLPVRR